MDLGKTMSLALETSQVTRSLKVGFSLSTQCELAHVNDHEDDRGVNPAVPVKAPNIYKFQPICPQNQLVGDSKITIHVVKFT